MSRTLCARELLMWARLHLAKACQADKLSGLPEGQYEHLSDLQQAEQLSKLQLMAGGHHVRCLTACERALALDGDDQTVYFKVGCCFACTSVAKHHLLV